MIKMLHIYPLHGTGWYTFPVKKIISSIFNDVKQIGYSSLTFEFLVSGGMSIIKIPLFERDMNGLLIVYS
jgi:hypothetical protein